jgi:hypothetical protein
MLNRRDFTKALLVLPFAGSIATGSVATTPANVAASTPAFTINRFKVPIGTSPAVPRNGMKCMVIAKQEKAPGVFDLFPALTDQMHEDRIFFSWFDLTVYPDPSEEGYPDKILPHISVSEQLQAQVLISFEEDKLITALHKAFVEDFGYEPSICHIPFKYHMANRKDKGKTLAYSQTIAMTMLG